MALCILCARPLFGYRRGRRAPVHNSVPAPPPVVLPLRSLPPSSLDRDISRLLALLLACSCPPPAFLPFPDCCPHLKFLILALVPLIPTYCRLVLLDRLLYLSSCEELLFCLGRKLLMGARSQAQK